MKISRQRRRVPRLVGLAAASLLAVACSRADPMPSASAVPVVPDGRPGSDAAAAVPPPAALAPPPADVPASWNAIRDDTYAERGAFAGGMTALADRLDAETRQLNLERASVPATSLKDWDVAMKALNDARSDLRYKIAQLEDATPETWAQAKEKAGLAWHRAEAARDQVRRSTTGL